jgi:aminoglycoside phosphotransferase (APT) family kinase protein
MANALTPAAVRAAIRAVFPALPVATCAPLGEGWDSAAWLIDDRLIFRFPKRAAVARALRVEIALLPALAAALPVPVPRFAYVARAGAPTDSAFPFVGYPALRGIFLDRAPDLLAPGSPPLVELAATLRALHRFPRARAVAAGLPARDWSGWVAHWEGWAAQAFADPGKRLTPAARDRAAALREQFLSELRRADYPIAVIHHDLALEHILVSPDGAHLAGIIDWGDLALGDPALDFVGVALGCPPATLDALLAAYGPTDARFRERIALYGQLGPFHLLHYGDEIGDTTIIAEAIDLIEKWADLSPGPSPIGEE